MFVEPADLDARVLEAQRRLKFWIKHHRLRLGISKTRLARLSGLTKQGVLYLLEGDREPKLRSLIAIATALDLEVTELLGPLPEGAVETPDDEPEE